MSYIPMNDPAHAMNQRKLFGHPVGLYFLFFTELWERFSYYGMRAILVLYITDLATNGGLGWTNGEALALYGWYTMAVYVASIPGGILADRLLGQKRTVMLGGLLLCIGHGVLAIDAIWAFYTGLAFIVLGVGGLKPNISSMVGGLYKPGDGTRDQGFTIFYIGINIGAFLAGILVASVASAYGWHAGFGLAGIGMLLGQIVYIYGQRFLNGVGDFIGKKGETKEEAMDRPLSKKERDRIKVLLISYLLIIVFWGAFEQAGGLMNLYAQQKIDRVIDGINFTVPAGWFQSVNSFFIITLGTAIGGFWIWWMRKGREKSSLFKMAVGTIIMGIGFVFMYIASMQAGAEPFGKAGMIWLVLAYLFHTVGELCASPVSLSFITKLAPLKYASIMMGIYWAAVGLGNKVAGLIGEASQSEPITVNLIENRDEVLSVIDQDDALLEDEALTWQALVYEAEGQVVLKDYEDKKDLMPVLNIPADDTDRLLSQLKEAGATPDNPYHARVAVEKDGDAAKVKENVGDGQEYAGTLKVQEFQEKQEKSIFLFIVAFTAIVGLLVLAFLKPLKRLTHGADEVTFEK